MLLKKKPNRVNISKELYAKIPFDHCYTEEGIIESGNHFTKMYEILESDKAIHYDAKIEQQKIMRLLNAFDNDISFQFLSHNELIEMTSYLKTVLVPGDSDLAKQYDHVVYNMADIGHNNVHKTSYLVVGISCDIIDTAIRRFKEIDPLIHEQFNGIYGLDVKPFPIEERLHLMYKIFNPEQNAFAKKIDLDGSGRVDLKNLKYMKLTTKDLVAPTSWTFGTPQGNSEVSFIDYSILNKDSDSEQYVRAFFVNSVPKVVSQNMISEFTNISSNMIFSVTYEPVDSQFGFDTVTELVKSNTQVVIKSKTDTIEDRKNRATTRITRLKEENESAYIQVAALDVLKRSVAAQQKVFRCTMTILLFAPSLELLDRDTKLLKISANKFAASVKTLDLQQLEGFQTCLPLCDVRVDTSRIFDSERLSCMIPINLQDVIKKGGMYYGLNSINGNLILLNRKHLGNYSGTIIGSEHSGKTFQNKREIVNALLSSKDRINIFAYNDEYDKFVTDLGGQIIESTTSSIFDIEPGYGLTDPTNYFKSSLLTAIITSLQDVKEFRHSSDDNSFFGTTDDISDAGSRIEDESQIIADELDNNPTGDIRAFIMNNDKLPYSKKALAKIPENYLTPGIRDERDHEKRLFLYKVNNISEVMMLMDHFWNICIQDKKKNTSNQLFIDYIDDIFRRPQMSEYLTEFMTHSSILQTVFTIVVQDAAMLTSNNTTSTGLENMLGTAGYIKLLSLGPNERKTIADKLHIPNTLIQYVTNSGLGNGLIITPVSNTAFSDTFLKDDKEFADIFAKKIEQLTFDFNKVQEEDLLSDK